ncbi:MAG: hypothetical protein QXX95_05050 [Nitrososphaerales archaeon]
MLFDITEPSGVKDARAYIQHPDETNIAALSLVNKNGKFKALWDATNTVYGTYYVDIFITDSLGNSQEVANFFVISTNESFVNPSYH